MASQETLHHTFIDSPIGRLFAEERGGSIVRMEFAGVNPPELRPDSVHDDEPFSELAAQLEEYFAGRRQRFDVPIRPEGTEFQMAVWSALLDIPYGETATYGEIAASIGRPTAVRAVGGANNANKIPIVIPCHRVIGADGSLTGFGGGLDTKAALLELESTGIRSGQDVALA